MPRKRPFPSCGRAPNGFASNCELAINRSRTLATEVALLLAWRDVARLAGVGSTGIAGGGAVGAALSVGMGVGGVCGDSGVGVGSGWQIRLSTSISRSTGTYIWYDPHRSGTSVIPGTGAL